MLRINALYDLSDHTYCDVIIQGKKKLHEHQALNSIVDRYHEPAPSIFIADRGYESFNVFAHMILKGQKFIIRIKDISSNGILSSYDLPDHKFDEYIETTLTRKRDLITIITCYEADLQSVFLLWHNLDNIPLEHRIGCLHAHIVWISCLT